MAVDNVRKELLFVGVKDWGCVKAEVEAMPKRSVMQMKIVERNMVDILLDERVWLTLLW